MGMAEIILIIVGAVVLVISFMVPAGKGRKDTAQAPQIDERMVRTLVEKEIEGAKSHINDMVDETLSYSMEKTERAMERLANEKIMAVNEYSEQVLAAINKNHQEVMFLYDMLNDKHASLVNTVSEASRKAQEIRQTVQDAEITVKEAVGMMAGDAEAISRNEKKAGKAGRVGKAGNADAVGKTGRAGNADVAGKVGRAGNANAAGGTGDIDAAGKAGDIDTVGMSGKAGDMDAVGKAGRAGDADVSGMSGRTGDVDTVGKTGKAGKTGGRIAGPGVVSMDMPGTVGRTVPENPEDRDEAEFIPIAPKRVELVHGMIMEDEASGMDGSKEPYLGVESGKGHNNNDKILRLHKLGMSKTAIAKELGLGVGEVKLVIDLFEQ